MSTKKCVCHIVKNVKDKRLSPFTQNSWDAFSAAAKIRQDDAYEKYKDEIEKGCPYGHYHIECYRMYTNQEHLNRIKNKWKSPRKKPKVCYSPSPAKAPLRRSSVSTPLKPNEDRCVICRKKTKYVGRFRSHSDKLLPVTEKSVEKKIKDAAKKRNDKQVLLDVEGKDLIAFRAKYHARACYTSYTSDTNLKGLTKKKLKLDPFTVAFEVIKTTIKSKVLKQKKVISLKGLKDEYVRELEKASINAKTQKLHKLKERIIKHYGKKVAFVQPSSTKPEYIYSAELQVATVLEIILKDKDSSDTQTEEENEAEEQAYDIEDENLAIFHCGIIINRLLKGMKTTLPWPPSPDNFTRDNIEVPDLLYNLLAYMMTGSAPAAEGERVHVDMDVDRMILSVAQDLINITKKGHCITVKNLGLAVAMRSMTGNKDASIMLNKFGHTIGYQKVLEFEKALVKKYEGDHHNALILPPTIRAGHCTLVWDNNDLNEETLSGAGTTHVTTGIIIQREVSLLYDISNFWNLL